MKFLNDLSYVAHVMETKVTFAPFAILDLVISRLSDPVQSGAQIIFKYLLVFFFF